MRELKKCGRVAVRIACYGLVALAVGCSRQQPAPDTRAADEAAIRQADIAFSDAAGKKQVDTFVSYYAPDASVFAPNAPIATGTEAIRKMWVQLVETPGFAISWQPVKVEAAGSGDLGYSYGTYEQTMKGPDGNPVTDRGKNVAVWKKQSDGTWKTVADIFNSDLPPAPPPAK